MISITKEPIDLCKILLQAMDRSVGGITFFIGTVRDHNDKESVSEIYYEAYKEMAEEKLAEIQLGTTQMGPPISFTIDGKQYIVVAISGGNYSGEYIAFALPSEEQ